MAVTAMSGIVGWGPQSGKNTTASTWYKHKATLVDIGVMDDTRLGAPEVGGDPVPSFPYKAGVMVGGGFTIQPRLESTVGWLMYSMLGSVASVQIGTSDAYTHTFDFDANDKSLVKWISARKYIPKKDGGADTDLGETYTDCKIVGMSFTLANDQPITSRVDLIGRSFTYSTTADTSFTWANTEYEDFTSIPLGCVVGGYLKLPSYSTTALAIQAATVSFQNVPLDVRQERVFGSPYIDDVTVIMRQLTFDIVVKWNDPDLYRAIVTNSTTGTEWSPTAYTSNLEIMMVSPSTIPSAAVPYSLKISAPNVMLQQAEGVTLAGNQAITTRFTGTAIAPASSTESYATFELVNDTTQYSWPV